MTEKQVLKILEQERSRKVKILAKYELIDYERSKNIKSIQFDQEHVQGGKGPNNNPFLEPTAKIIQLEEEIESLRKPDPLFENLTNILPSQYRKVIIGYYGNCKTISEIQEDWDVVAGIGGKRPSRSSLLKWKKEAISFMSKNYKSTR